MTWGERVQMTFYRKYFDYTLRKKKCNFPAFLSAEFSLFHRSSNFWVLQENSEQFWNRFFCTLLPRALAKWNTLQSSSIYTLPKKKCNFPCCVSFEEECRVASQHPPAGVSSSQSMPRKQGKQWPILLKFYRNIRPTTPSQYLGKNTVELVKAISQEGSTAGTDDTRGNCDTTLGRNFFKNSKKCFLLLSI